VFVINRKILITAALFFLLIASSCAPQAAPEIPPAAVQTDPAASQTGTITVMAAASLTSAFEEIGKQFESRHPGSKVDFNFAGSQQLAQQIAQGAPADVFASANAVQMDAVVSSGRIDPDAPLPFAKNRLVVIYPKSNPGHINRIQDLAKPGLKIVLAAREVPVGQYAFDFLDKASLDASFGAAFKDGVINNIVSYEDNVKAVLTKVSLNEADAGIVYLTDAASTPENTVAQMEIPDAYNVTASYPIAAMNDSQNANLANAFIELVLSQTGQDLLKEYGFLPVEN
jgi:molybdate transport system substrate-binding protein